MTEQEVYKKIKPLLENSTEGLYWDFKETLFDEADIIKDILAFSNSAYKDESYIIVGVSEPKTKKSSPKISLSSEDRRRLRTDANYIYLPENWQINGLSADEISKMKEFSAKLTEKMAAYMLISQPKCEFVPVQINKSRWLYVIVVKKNPGVFLCKKDVPHVYDSNKIAIKQGVLYVRIADITVGARTDIATATEYLRVFKNYFDWLQIEDKC